MTMHIGDGRTTPFSPDEAEAFANGHLFGVKIVPLSSGNFAYFLGDELAVIGPNIHPPLVLELFEAQVEAYRAKHLRSTKLNASDLLKELGL